jgi:2-polyprenyl-3-methyl-5-hydroxy-6-metoxy-1,4-benzoquinol methylase
MSAQQDAMQVFVGKLVGDMGAAFTAPLNVLGDRLGLFAALAEIGPATADAVAAHTGLFPRYVREWLAAQAAAGNVTHADGAGADGAGASGGGADAPTFALSPEQAMAFTDQNSPVFMPGAYEIVASMFKSVDRMEAAFRTGAGVGWGEHDACLFRGTERFFKPGYAANLVSAWLPALDGVVAKLEAGATVADVGCGHGATTVLMAQAYPNSRFHGFDYHVPSVERARARAIEAGVADRVQFQPAMAQDFPGTGYDLVTFFDCLHDMGDPAGAARHVRQALAADGTWMIVEPFAHDALRHNLNPVGRVFYAASAMICTPASQAQEGACCLGAQAGEQRLRTVVQEGGFRQFRRATETPFNLVLEARP